MIGMLHASWSQRSAASCQQSDHRTTRRHREAGCCAHVKCCGSPAAADHFCSTADHLTRTPPQGSKALTEWSDLATAVSDDYVPEEDPLFQEDINRLCNVGLKAMLRDERREVSEWQDELNQVTTTSCSCWTFKLRVYSITDHSRVRLWPRCHARQAPQCALFLR